MQTPEKKDIRRNALSAPDGDRIAAALAYAPGRDAAPRVVAAGRGPIAARIQALAEQHGVVVREDAQLAPLLAAVDIGDAIPEEAFIAVAEILAVLSRADRNMSHPCPTKGSPE